MALLSLPVFYIFSYTICVFSRFVEEMKDGRKRETKRLEKEKAAKKVYRGGEE
jgi:hypothetical protein